MVKIPIPDDWDNQTFECVQVQWPDSPKWLALLAGFLTTPMRGRFWDERTGSIKDVQLIGQQIDNLNLPFTNCNGEVINPDDDGGGIISLTGGAIMDCSIPYGSLRWGTSGQLQYKYCGIWYDVEGAPAIDAPIGSDYTPPEITGGGYSACGKATAVMDMVMGVISSILDEVGNFSWQWWGHVKNDNPGVGMDAKWIILACEGAVNQAAADAAAGDAYDPNALDPTTWQSVKCSLALDFSDTMPEPLSGNDVRSKLQSYFAREWGIDVLTNAIFVDALRGINRESFENAIATGASYEDGDCDCPAEAPPGQESGETASGWYLSAPLIADFISPDPPTYPDYGFGYHKQVLPHDIYGLVVIMSPLTGTMDHWKRTNAPAPAFMGIHDVYMSGNNSDNFPLAVPAAYAFISANQFTEFNNIGELTGWARIDPLTGTGSEVIASPVALKNQIALMSFTVYDTSAGTFRVNMRWLHNVNSPSHG